MTRSETGAARIENREYYDEFSKTYEDRRHEGYHVLIDELQSELVIDAVGGLDALEVGCGTGLILQRVAPAAKRAVGIDLSPGMLSLARERGLEVQEASATELPFQDETFDVSYSFKVLSHVPDLALALSEMGRVLRPGGRSFIGLYNRQSLRYLIRRLRGGHAIAEGIDDNQVFFRFYSPDEMIEQLPESLELVQLHGVRIATTLPSMVSWPVLGPSLCWLERRLRSSLFARFGGFMVLECRKK
ncbi:MAG TPA: class I SAM-dependent methyltransferase [Deltaproteobacteria bacterium]|nr:hypothetical protein [Deltaproteobacteria bacterium]HCP46607.1 class I SAM-dependent methyltransferase [Deltaproteobacteria bacterium]|tara:strand:- start:409 stop:1143 length:735 start_codon:yes stop_codon:yes gene_type:complete